MRDLKRSDRAAAGSLRRERIPYTAHVAPAW